MPVARKPMILGFVGTGATSAKNIAALLSDLIEANGGKAKFVLPATEANWTEGIEAVAEFALENDYPVTLITDDTTAKVKALKGILPQATEKIKVTKPVHKVVQICGGEANSKLIVLWDDEDDDCYTALEAAEQNEVPALDLCAGLHPLEFSGDSEQAEDEEPETEVATDEEPEADDLDEMNEAELQDLAETLGLDVEEYPEWDDVREAIREIQAEGGEAEAEGDPTADEVMEWDFATCKEFAQANGIEVPPRSKTFGYRKAIADWLEGQEGDEDEVALDEDDTEVESVLEVLEAVDYSGVLEEIQSSISSLAIQLSNLDRAFTENLIEIRTAIMEMAPTGTVQKAQQTAARTVPAKSSATTTKKAAPAPQKAAQRSQVARRPKASAAPKKPAGRLLDPFMHLLGKKLTKAQATEIMTANAYRGRGRPTENERQLVAAARALVPNL